jgi:hypothetical protein
MLPIEGADDAAGKAWGFYSNDDGDDDYFDPTVRHGRSNDDYDDGGDGGGGGVSVIISVDISVVCFKSDHYLI